MDSVASLPVFFNRASCGSEVHLELYLTDFAVAISATPDVVVAVVHWLHPGYFPVRFHATSLVCVFAMSSSLFCSFVVSDAKMGIFVQSKRLRTAIIATIARPHLPCTFGISLDAVLFPLSLGHVWLLSYKYGALPRTCNHLDRACRCREFPRNQRHIS